jgi:predicted nucleic acid-binding protein
MVRFYEELVELFGQNLAVSVVTVYEVLRGMRPGEEQRTKEFLEKLKCLPVTKEIAEKAAEYERDFRAKGKNPSRP